MFPGEGVSGYPFPHRYLSQPHRAREKVLSGEGKGLRETDHTITSRNTEEEMNALNLPDSNVYMISS